MADVKLNDAELDAVAGGMNDVNNSGSSAGGNQTIYDESTTTIKQKADGDIVEGDKNTSGGDQVKGNKTDVKTEIDTTVNVKASLF
ncbi:MAG: hypothetical protein IJ054_03940 [Lachnospiraceae bacterium]|nr:hypothetical protein [Lachnospiraceae bacterium]MBQ9233959.1 hypothetical protein [Lachnospiraceae bacterium]